MTEYSNRGRLRPLLSGVVLRSQSDERLCALARAGHQPAFDVIFERYRRELGSHAARIVRADRADDIVQQAMLAAWTTLVDGPAIADLRAWLHRVVHNAALDGRSGHDVALTMGLSEGAMRQLVRRARAGVRTAASAATPLPLINWLIGTGASATPAALGLAGGGAATAAKVIAVLGVTATLGVTHTLEPRHSPRSNPVAATGQTRPVTLAFGRPAAAVEQVAVVEPTKLAHRPSAVPAPPAGRKTTPEPGAASGRQVGNTAKSQSGSQNAANAQGGPSSPTPPGGPSGDSASGAGQAGDSAPAAGQTGDPAPRQVASVAADGSAGPQPAAMPGSDQSGSDGSPPPAELNPNN